MHNGKYLFLKAAFIVITTFAVYYPAMDGGFIWDDNKYVSENPLLMAPDGLKRIWISTDVPSQYFPLTYTTFWLEYKLWGLNPVGYHIVNVVLHTINALLVWMLLSRLSVPGAWLASAIFALHPVHVESVAWITERKNVLSCLFYLLAIAAWLKFIGKSASGSWKYYFLIILLYLLALFSKTTAVTLPAALLLIYWFKERRIEWKAVLNIMPLMVLGIMMGLITMWWEYHHQGTQGKEFAFSVMERLLIASRSLWFYSSKLIWPTYLTFSYPRWDIDSGVFLQYGWFIGSIVLTVALWRYRHMIGKGLIVGISFFVANLAPMLGFISLYTFRYTFVADHYQYIASIGLIALFAGAVTQIREMVDMRLRVQYTLLFLILLFLGMLTWKQSHAYKDAETLWRDTLRKNESSWLAHNNLGNVLAKDGRFGEATQHYYETLRLKPDFAEAHYNLGKVLIKTGKIEEAIVHYLQATRQNPNFAEAHFALGNCLSKLGRMKEATAHYREALRIKPDYAVASYNLDVILEAEEGAK